MRKTRLHCRHQFQHKHTKKLVVPTYGTSCLGERCKPAIVPYKGRDSAECVSWILSRFVVPHWGELQFIFRPTWGSVYIISKVRTMCVVSGLAYDEKCDIWMRSLLNWKHKSCSCVYNRACKVYIVKTARSIKMPISSSKRISIIR